MKTYRCHVHQMSFYADRPEAVLRGCVMCRQEDEREERAKVHRMREEDRREARRDHRGPSGS